MRIYLTRHAQARMAERGIGRAQVIHVLEHPALSEPTPQGSIKVEGTIEHAGTLKVWVAATDGPDGTPTPSLDAHGRVIVKSTAWKD